MAKQGAEVCSVTGDKQVRGGGQCNRKSRSVLRRRSGLVGNGEMLACRWRCEEDAGSQSLVRSHAIGALQQGDAAPAFPNGKGRGEQFDGARVPKIGQDQEVGVVLADGAGENIRVEEDSYSVRGPGVGIRRLLAPHDRAVCRRFDGQRYFGPWSQTFQHRPRDRDLAFLPQSCEFHERALLNFT